jgi:hypothetical protein
MRCEVVVVPAGSADEAIGYTSSRLNRGCHNGFLGHADLASNSSGISGSEESVTAQVIE